MVRAVELTLGVPIPGIEPSSQMQSNNVTSALIAAANDKTSPSDIFTSEVRSALLDAIPVIVKMGSDFFAGSLHDFKSETANSQREPLVTRWVAVSSIEDNNNNSDLPHSFMDINWQFNSPANPADAAIGPQAYDDHLYYGYVPR